METETTARIGLTSTQHFCFVLAPERETWLTPGSLNCCFFFIPFKAGNINH